jgi:hypothetical protein
MASFLAGLTDEILPPLLYKPDYNLQFNELNIGTQKYNLHKDQLERLWADYFNSPLTNPNNILERENIKKDVEEKLTKFAGLNFADIKVNEGIKGLINTVGANKHIVNDIAFTRRVNEYNTTLDLLKLSPGTKENNYLTYNPDQKKELERQVREFAGLTDKNEIANYKFRDPIYKNYDRIIGDYIKDYDAKIVTADVVPEYDEKGKVVTYKDGYGRNVPINLLVETKNGKMTLPEWQQMIKDHLTKYHGYGEYLSWKTDLDVDASLLSKGIDVHRVNSAEKNELRFNELWDKIKKGGVDAQYNAVIDNYNTIYETLKKRKDRLYYEMNSQLNFNTLTSLKKDTLFDYEKRKNLQEEYNNITNNLTSIGNIINDIKANKDITERIKNGELSNLTYNHLKTLYMDMMSTIDTDRMASNWINTHFEQKIKESPASLKALDNRPPSSSGSKDSPTEVIEKHGSYADDNVNLNLVEKGSNIELSQESLKPVKNENITVNVRKTGENPKPITDNVFNWSKIFGVNELNAKSNEHLLSLIDKSPEQNQGASSNSKSLVREVHDFALFSKDDKVDGVVQIKFVPVTKSFVKSIVKKGTDNSAKIVEFTAPRSGITINKHLVNSFNEQPGTDKYGAKITTDKDVRIYNSAKHTDSGSENYINIEADNARYSIRASELLAVPDGAYRSINKDLALIRMEDGSIAVVKDEGSVLGNLLGTDINKDIRFESDGKFITSKQKSGVSRPENIILFKYKLN